MDLNFLDIDPFILNQHFQSAVGGGRISPSVSDAEFNSPQDSIKVEIQSLKYRLERGNVKISKVSDLYINFFEQYQEYDAFLVSPEPSNPWISDSVDFWELEKQTLYLAPDAKEAINIDSRSFEITKRNMEKPDRWTFEEAAAHLYQLMKSDSYSRYLRSEMYKEYLNGMKKKTSVKGIRSVISFSAKKEQQASSS
ncbi:regulator of G-protein signaling 7 [Trichonephila inaurata madagascariensis]|uniref:Regulator of G-protein signaling 7 n=1 Tax=Trichonephila inaurata madagascariensis TaxID=2747483 RepID=A0A8X6Y918_9ARAC|nr:regulator of G-protein signaling 7 [Trichonephila inaurata madagascariensis]